MLTPEKRVELLQRLDDYDRRLNEVLAQLAEADAEFARMEERAALRDEGT